MLSRNPHPRGRGADPVAHPTYGTGIRLEGKDEMLNPFFTTRPTGEGTELGLSIRHDVIVKQPGEFIEPGLAAVVQSRETLREGDLLHASLLPL